MRFWNDNRQASRRRIQLCCACSIVLCTLFFRHLTEHQVLLGRSHLHMAAGNQTILHGVNVVDALDESRQMRHPVQLQNITGSPQKSGESPNCHLLYSKFDEPCPVKALVPRGGPQCRPSYFIAGTRKGGTTSLHTYLASHPSIFPFRIQGNPQDGESFARLGSQEMANQFSRVPEGVIVGDSTVSRIISDGYGHFAAHCNESRVILLLRDPVERCYSQMLMRHRLGSMGRDFNVSRVIKRELDTFKAKVQTHPEIISEVWTHTEPFFLTASNCLFEGAYAVHLRRLLHPTLGIPKERVRIYWTQDLLDAPAGVVRDAMAFVGADPSRVDLEQVTSATYNTKPRSQSKRTNPQTVLLPKLREAMKSAMRPFNQELAEYLGAIPPWMGDIQVSAYPKDKLGLPLSAPRWQKREATKDTWLKSTASATKEGQQPLPTIWMLWDKGLDQAPKMVRVCYHSWILHNPDYRVRLLDLTEAEHLIQRSQHVPDLLWRYMKIPAKSDVIRTIILRDFGGVWTDATVLCLQPLSQWLSPNRFVTFRRDDKPESNKKPWLVSWFLSAPRANHYVFKRVVNEVDRLWLQFNSTWYSYHWLHEIFASLCASDSRFAEEVSAPTLESADGPHCITGRRADQHMLKRCWNTSDLASLSVPLRKKYGKKWQEKFRGLVKRRPLTQTSEHHQDHSH